MVRKIKNTGHNIPEIVLSLVPPFEEQGQDRENSSSQHSKNNKSHKKRKNRKQKQTKKYIIPDIIVTDLSDDAQDKGLTNSNLNSNSNKIFPKNIINIEDNEIISTNHDFVDFDCTFNESNNNIKQQKKEELITNKNLLLNNNNNINNPSSKHIKTNQLWKFLKKKFLIKGYDLQTIS